MIWEFSTYILVDWIYWFPDVQDTHNQAGIAHCGGIVPLLKLLESKNGSLQHNAAFALYGLADNEVLQHIQTIMLL